MVEQAATSRRRSATRERARRCRRTSTSRGRRGRRRTSPTTSSSSSIDAATATATRLRRRAQACRRRSTSACRSSRTRRSTRRSRARRARRRRSSRSTRATGGSSRWSAASNYHHSQFNLAVQGERQPGSSFKPFVLATALQRGRLAADDLRLEAAEHLPRRQYWPVHNFDNEYLGPTTVENGTIHSDNAVYAQLTQLVGPKNVARDGARARRSRATSTATSRSGSAPRP